MISVVLTATCLLILTWHMFGYYDLVQRVKSPKSNVTVVLWQVDHISNLTPSTLPLSTLNLDAIDVNNIDYRMLITELAHYFIVLNSTFADNGKTDNVYANILMLQEPEAIVLREENPAGSHNQVEDINCPNNAVREVEIPTVNLKKVAVIEFLLEDEIPAILKFVQYFSENEIISVKKYLDYISREEFQISSEDTGTEKHDTTSGISFRVKHLAILSSLALLTCIAFWGKRHYLHKRNMLMKSDRYLTRRISIVNRSMKRAENLQKLRAEKYECKNDSDAIKTVKQQLITFQDSVAHKVLDEEKIETLKRNCCLHEKNVQQTLQLIHKLEKRMQDCIIVNKHVANFLEENIKHLKRKILRKDASGFDRELYATNISDAVAKLENNCKLEKDPNVRIKYANQITSLTETLNLLKNHHHPTPGGTRIGGSPLDEGNLAVAHLNNENQTPQSPTLLTECVSKTKGILQYFSPTKMEVHQPGISVPPEAVIKSVMGEKWTHQEQDCTENLRQPALRWIGGIWYLDGKKCYPNHLTDSLSSMATSTIQIPGTVMGNSASQLHEDSPVEEYTSTSRVNVHSVA